MFAAKAGKAGLDLLYDIDAEVPLQLLGDSKRLREVLMNLVENAVKFTQRGEILVNVLLLKMIVYKQSLVLMLETVVLVCQNTNEAIVLWHYW